MAVSVIGDAPTAPQRAVRAGARPVAVRASSAQGDRLDRVQMVLLIAGSVLIPLGILAIILGWYGASHTPYGFEQTPYVISGGILGLGLIFAGGFLYFGAWMVRSAAAQRRDTDRLLDALEAMSQLIPTGTGARPINTPALVTTRTGSQVHRPDCSIVTGRTDLKTVTTAQAATMKPCRLCDPLGAQA
ncbi:MAG TPA: hypothetical protein VHE83_12395 [Mycobacteriales bacterium]|nr:hypothetical protein [Mycobacteriales bacterium]